MLLREGERERERERERDDNKFVCDNEYDQDLDTNEQANSREG